MATEYSKAELGDISRVVEVGLRLVTFGCGDHFDRSKFQPIANRDFAKPHGGLWASPLDAKWGWKEWSESEQFGDLSTQFEFDFRGRVLTIDKVDDLAMIPRQQNEAVSLLHWPDFEAIAGAGVDAIHLTEKGEQETRFGNPSLYGWDCECVLVMNPDAIQVE